MPKSIGEIREQIRKKDELMGLVNAMVDNEWKMVEIKRMLKKHGKELGLSDKLLE
jgi:hypothetical protein